MNILVGARGSPLSRVQCEEVKKELQEHHPDVVFTLLWVETTGDKDKQTSLRSMGKTDFFTKELDEMLLNESIRIAIHSAKDLPDPIPKGLIIAAITKGVDSRDSLVLRTGESIDTLKVVATSSTRREEIVRSLRPDLQFVDLRGTIGERLAKLDRGEIDGVVMAEAALIRLGLTHLNRIFLPGPVVEGQGQLAILCREEDREMRDLFSCIQCKPRILYLGTDPSRFNQPCIHYPIIQTIAAEAIDEETKDVWPRVTHLIFTSPNAVKHWFNVGKIEGRIAIAIGEGTRAALRKRGVEPLIAPTATQEGVIELLKTIDLTHAFLLLPRSSRARETLTDYLKKRGVDFHVFDLYRTVTHKTEPLPDLNQINEIIFTSPSTIDAFREIFGKVPDHIRIRCIGPITKQKFSSG